MFRQNLISIVVILVSFGFVFILSDYLENIRPELPENYADEDLSLQGEKLRGYSFGTEGLIADWYWMRSLQYIGEKLEKSKLKTINIADLKPLNPRLLYPLLDNATTLDPRFMAAYSYGAIVLPAIDPDQAIKIVTKGIDNNPDEWRFYQYLGYIHWELKDYQKAAEVYQTGSEINGAPPWMRSMAAKMKNEGGERQTAREIYGRLFAEAEDSQTKESARLRLLELDSLDERDLINAELTRLKSKTGTCPKNWSDIIPGLRGKKLPSGKEFRIDANGNLVDPSNAPYLIDPSICEAILDFRFTKIPER